MSAGNLIIFYIGILLIPSIKQIFTMSQCYKTKGDCVADDKRGEYYCKSTCFRKQGKCDGYVGVDLFGKDQKYQCHCKHLRDCQFHILGECKNGCLPGYEEPYCQKRKYHEFIRNEINQRYSDLFSSNKVAVIPPIVPKFRNKYRINTIEIFSNFSDSTINATYPGGLNCKVKNKTKNVTICTGNVTTNRLNITGTAGIYRIQLFGCPPELYGENCTNKCHCSGNESCHQITGVCQNGCEDGWYGKKCDEPTYVNIAQGQQTNQSSTYGEKGTRVFDKGTCTDMPTAMISKKAVDGNFDPGVLHKSCTNTKWEEHPYWQVTFDKPYSISQLRIYNRMGTNRKRLRGFQVHLGSTLCFESKNNEHLQQVIHIQCAKPVNSSNVKISLTGYWRMLTLCEVEVLQCVAGFYGDVCKERCDKCESLKCDQVTGHCEGGCIKGYFWSDNNNMCKECPSGKFGKDCKEVCHCSETCNHINGSCPGQCDAGYTEYNCQKVCKIDKYGINCSGTCHCMDNKNCNKTSGECSDGCSAGYEGKTCGKQCDKGSFGVDCKEACHCSLPCNHVNGSCPGDCDAGYTGFNCQEGCQGDRFGVNCKDICHCADNNNCNRINGTCLDGCADGYEGDNCQKEKPTQNTLVIVLVVLILFILLGIAAYLWSRGKRPIVKSDKKILQIPQNNNAEAIPQDTAHIYEETSLNESESIYVNLASASFKSNLQKYVSEKKEEVEPFNDEFLGLPKTLPLPYTEATKPENMKKNRYKTILPYDHSRVKLQPDEISSSDYINANFISNRRYIASQGPTQNTVTDFWRMIWQLNCNTIVMLTDIVENGKVKCMQYWSDEEKTESFGNIQVTHINTSYHSTHIHRRFIISKTGVYQNETWTIDHFFFNKWPDHGIPRNVEYILEFRNALKFGERKISPLVVHCSAGVGRTGTYICIDILLNAMSNNEPVDVLACIRKLREDRMYMVQKRIQLEFIYDVLVENILTGDYNIDVDNIPREFSRIKETDNSTRVSILEHQFQDVIKQVEVRDTNTTLKEGEEEYANFSINGVFIDGPSCEKEFLVTKSPNDDTVVQFLMCLHKRGYLNIVAFDSSKERSNYLPRTLNESVMIGPYFLQLIHVDSKGVCIHRVLKVECDTNSRIEEFEINHFQVTIWTDRNYPSCADILQLSNILSTHQNEQFNKKIAVYCRKNFHKSGLLCIVHLLKAAITNQSVINIVRLVRMVKKIESSIVPDCDSYAFIWKVAEYLQNESSLYSNFVQ